ncbi:MAG: 16S rRNA (cytosine(1402)-N(4))-methyltransferase RsmH [Aquiluna sp.]|nr:16S rRNA (cytosine(1402)-N(4))-methyltransferase RsmH [Aquiluna sp.]
MTQEISELHRPVMLQRCLELLKPAIKGSKAVVIDCTLGLGGHTEALLEEHPDLSVIGIDRDPMALELASKRLQRFGKRFIPAEATYDQIAEVLAENGIESVQGILMDLGVSSMQLDESDRGFAYAQDAPLDMRMNQQVGNSAAHLLAELSDKELTAIFKNFGEERHAALAARKIVEARKASPISTSGQLNKLIASVIPAAPGKTSGHPAKRIYQALRIAVNDELGGLERALPQAIDALATGARLVVMSYHSLEDGIVKRAFQQGAVSSTPIEMPMQLPGTSPKLSVLTRGVERATEFELSQNPRAASARLRAAEKLEVY